MAMLLNDTSKNQLKDRISSSQLRKPKEFSIIFLGDTHIGMDRRGHSACNYSSDHYMAILRSIDSNDDTLAAIFVGGDAGHKDQFVAKFASITSTLMMSKPHQIPIFSGVGNHEYMHGHLLKGYKEHISKTDNDIIQLFEKDFGPKVAVIMLNTGGPGSNGYASGNNSNLAKSITQIKNNPIYQSIVNDKSIMLIIDMHIPPCIPVFTKVSETHVLSSLSENYFHEFVTSIGPNKILAIVTHHLHGYIQSHINTKHYYMDQIPVFLTAQGGNCDPVMSSALSSKYSYYKLNFSTKSPKSRKSYKLKSVYRFDINVSNSTVIKKVKIY